MNAPRLSSAYSLLANATAPVVGAVAARRLLPQGGANLVPDALARVGDRLPSFDLRRSNGWASDNAGALALLSVGVTAIAALFLFSQVRQLQRTARDSQPRVSPEVSRWEDEGGQPSAGQPEEDEKGPDTTHH